MIKVTVYECDTVEELLAALKGIEKNPDGNSTLHITPTDRGEVSGVDLEKMLREKGYLHVTDSRSKAKFCNIFKIRLSKRNGKNWYNITDIESVPPKHRR